MVHKGEQMGFYHQFILSAAFPAVLHQIGNLGKQQFIARISGGQIIRNRTGMVVNRLEIFLITGVLGRGSQQRETEQYIKIFHVMLIQLLHGVNGLGRNQKNIACLHCISVGVNGHTALSVHNVDELHLIVPVQGIRADVFREIATVNDIGKGQLAVGFRFVKEIAVHMSLRFFANIISEFCVKNSRFFCKNYTFQNSIMSNRREEAHMSTMLVNDREYDVIKLLGHGKGGYSYLVTDGQQDYVLKQIHHEPCDYYQFGNKIEAERRDYGRLRETGIPMPRMIALDEERERILKEYIDGPTVYDLILQDNMRESYLEQARQMSEAVFRHGLNIDYFPTNFVAEEGRLYYIDYECNDYMEEWSFENWGIKYWSKTEEFLTYVHEHPSI